jgi:hypothetical protein
MTITEASTRVAVQWRAFVGPPYRRNDALDYYDWPALNLGDGTPTPGDAIMVTDLAPGATSVVILEGTGTYNTPGGAWIGPGAVGETWEYVTNTGSTYDSGTGQTTLTGLTREAVSAEQTGYHTAGATVRFWWPLMLDAPPDFTSQTGAKLADKYWSAKLKGGLYPQAALRNGQLCIVQARWAEGTGTWGSWQTELIGWLLNPHVKDGAADFGAWDSDYVSSRQMLDLTFVGGLRVGAQNVAISGNATGSTQLSATYKEAGTGEFLAAAPDVSPASAIDGDMDTLYISERHVGSASYPDMAGTVYLKWGPDEIHIASYVGQGEAGYRWIQASAGTFGAMNDWKIKLINTDGYFPSFYPFYPEGLTWNASHPFQNNTYTPLIFVENEILFRQENPDLGVCEIVEISGTNTTFGNSSGSAPSYTADNWWDSFAPAGGSLLVLIGQGPSFDNYGGEAVWGTASAPGGGSWTGAALPPVGAGETIRRKWFVGTGTAVGGWAVGPQSMPGYWLNGTDTLYHDTQLKPIGLTLRDNITSTQTTDIYITGVAGDTLDGLPASGEIQIGSEKMTYTAKATTNDYIAGTVTRGTSSTTPVLHNAGDLIRVVEGGVATDAFPLAAVHVKRKAGQPIPQTFNLRWSTLQIVRPPSVAGFWGDYTAPLVVPGNTLHDYVYNLPTATRYRHMLIDCTAMSTDPYRLMLNEIELIPDLSVFSSARTLTTGTIAEAQAALLALAGLDSSAITDNGDTPTVVDYTTDSGMCGTICADLADYGGCRFEVGRDSKVTLRLDPYWSGGSLPSEVVDWIPALASSIDGDFRHGLAVGQVLLTWRNADNSDHGTVRYPPTKDPLGAVVTMGPFVYADATAALAGATKRYWQARRPFGVLIEAAGTAWAHDAGEVCGLLWTPSADNILDRTYMVQQARHLGQESALTVLQISGVVE